MKKIMFLIALSPIFALSALELDAPVGGEYVVLDLQPKAASHVEELTDANFNSKIAQGYAVVDFYATWCGPCRAYGPTFAKVADEMHTALSFYKANVEKANQATAAAQIYAIPTTIVYRDGKEVKRILGNLSENDLKEFILSGISK